MMSATRLLIVSPKVITYILSNSIKINSYFSRKKVSVWMLILIGKHVVRIFVVSLLHPYNVSN